MSETTPTLQAPRPLFGTARRDTWWLGPLAIALGLIAFIAYAAWAALQGAYYQWGPYVSPFYSPHVDTSGWGGLSPALLVVWAPGGFRLTCYYFRKAYYRSLFLTPPACAVGGRPQSYRGERALFIFQNLHRYFLYMALVLLVFHVHDTWLAFQFPEGFGIGIGSLVILLDLLLLAGFVFGCNALRHLVGGGTDCYSCVKFGKQRYLSWRFVSFFNRYHAEFAWVSLFWVGFADLYVRLLAMGIITDLRIF